MYGGLELDAFTARSHEDNCVADGKELRFVEMDAVKDEAFDILLVVGKNVQREKILQECRALMLTWRRRPLPRRKYFTVSSWSVA